MTIWAIARNTFREAVRDRIFGLVGAFGVVLVLSSMVLSPLTIGAQAKIVADVGLASVSLFALLVVLLVGSGMVHKEIDKRTIMTMLSKPISRLEYLLGKYLGLMMTIFVMMVAMTLLFLLVVLGTPTEYSHAFLVSALLSVAEMMVVTAVVVFFSSFTTPVLTSLFTLGVFLGGRAMHSLEAFAIVANNDVTERSVTVFKWILPNLDLFNVRNAAVHGLDIPSEHVLWSVGYALLYSGVLLALAGWLFERRDFR